MRLKIPIGAICANGPRQVTDQPRALTGGWLTRWWCGRCAARRIEPAALVETGAATS